MREPLLNMKALAVWVPWPVVQEIMAAILARAALAKETADAIRLR